MDIIQHSNEKLAIINIIVGFILGIYLGLNHNNPDLWWTIIQWGLITTVLITVIATLMGVYSNREEFKISSVIRIFLLNLAMVAVSLSFGFVLTSIVIGNFGTFF